MLMKRNFPIGITALLSVFNLLVLVSSGLAAPNLLELKVQSRLQAADGSWQVTHSVEKLDLAKTAIVVIDMWDKHSCKSFTAKLGNMVPRMNPVLDAATGGESVDFRYEPGVPPRPYDVGAYAAAIVRVAEEEKTWVVDHYSLWKASMSTVYRGEMRYLMSDCIHPNDSGDRRFYHELAPVFGVEPFFQHDWQHILCQSAPVL